jgi:FeS assembly SUF system regulator
MLRITKQTDYGIVLMTCLARGEEGTIHKTRDLAEGTGIPLPMVSKILKSLAKSDLLVSHRGVHGGYSLARNPRDISVAEMIDALEGLAITECVDANGSSECRHDGTCPVQANWNRINRAIRAALEEISLSEMTQPLPPDFPANQKTLFV